MLKHWVELPFKFTAVVALLNNILIYFIIFIIISNIRIAWNKNRHEILLYALAKSSLKYSSCILVIIQACIVGNFEISINNFWTSSSDKSAIALSKFLNLWFIIVTCSWQKLPSSRSRILKCTRIQSQGAVHGRLR